MTTIQTAVRRWPCLLATPIRLMSDTSTARPLRYDTAPAMAPATGSAGEAVMLIAPRHRGGSSTAVVGDRGVIRDMARQGGRRVLEVAVIDRHGCMVPASKHGTRRGERL